MCSVVGRLEPSDSGVEWMRVRSEVDRSCIPDNICPATRIKGWLTLAIDHRYWVAAAANDQCLIECCGAATNLANRTRLQQTSSVRQGKSESSVRPWSPALTPDRGRSWRSEQCAISAPFAASSYICRRLTRTSTTLPYFKSRCEPPNCFTVAATKWCGRNV